MLHQIHNINVLIDEIINSKIIGIGEFSHGTSECYKIRIKLIEKIIKKLKKIDIYFEAPNIFANNIDKYITGKEKLNLYEEYNFRNVYPLMDYVGYRVYDCVEMLNFIKKLKSFNKKYDIRFFGVDVLIQSNSSDTKRLKKKIDLLYPQIKKDKSSFTKFLIEKVDLYNNRDKFMCEAIKFLYNKRKRFGIYLAHDWHVGYNIIPNYCSCGKYLSDYFGSEYISILTSSSCGTVRIDGEIDKFNNMSIYKIPKSMKFNDMGSLSTYIKNIYSDKNNIMIFKTNSKTKLSIFEIGWAKEDYKNINIYVNIHSDYIIHIFKSTATHNIEIIK